LAPSRKLLGELSTSDFHLHFHFDAFYAAQHTAHFRAT
jgi:hypothetical protein